MIAQVNAFTEEFKRKNGVRLIYCGDELYVKGGIPIPEGDYYEGYPQIENGVGLMRNMEDEFEDELSYLSEDYDLTKERHVSLVTGMAAADYITRLAAKLSEMAPKTRIDVYPIRNDFFGHSITVAGLLCGCDVKAQLAGKDLGDKLIIPAVMLRAQRDLFLDGMTPEELSEALKVPIVASESTGADFISAIFG